MIKKIIGNLNRRKVKLFSIFLLCSGAAWFVSNLTEAYTNTTVFDLEYINVPDSLLLTAASKNEIEVKLRASGFQFLMFNFSNKKVRIDLSSIVRKKEGFFISQKVYKKQIEKQLPASMSLLDLDDSDVLSFELLQLYSKEVPVESMMDVDLEHDYLLDGGLKLDPSMVTISGPKNEVDAITVLKTEERMLSGVVSGIKEKLQLVMPKGVENVSLSSTSVVVSGSVFRFSEKIIKIPVEVINLPQGMKIKTFPNKVSVLCRAKIDQLKSINSADFNVVADYGLVKDTKSTTIVLELTKRPKNIFSARLQETEVEYILRRE